MKRVQNQLDEGGEELRKEDGKIGEAGVEREKAPTVIINPIALDNFLIALFIGNNFFSFCFNLRCTFVLIILHIVLKLLQAEPLAINGHAKIAEINCILHARHILIFRQCNCALNVIINVVAGADITLNYFVIQGIRFSGHSGIIIDVVIVVVSSHLAQFEFLLKFETLIDGKLCVCSVPYFLIHCVSLQKYRFFLACLIAFSIRLFNLPTFARFFGN